MRKIKRVSFSFTESDIKEAIKEWLINHNHAKNYEPIEVSIKIERVSCRGYGDEIEYVNEAKISAEILEEIHD